MKKRALAWLLALLTTLSLTACGGQTTQDDNSSRTDVVIAQTADPSSLDPHYCYELTGMRIYRNMFESLLKSNADGTLSPCLAESYEISEGGMVYTFKLRQDVTFQNGDPMTAADVKYSYDRACGSAYCAEAAEPIDHTDIIDNYTVAVTMKYPYAAQLPFFATTYLAIVNQKVVDALGDNFGIGPEGAGTGPYTFSSWTKGSQVVMVRNEKYWGDLPAMTQVTYRCITEAGAGDIAVETGDIDVFLEPSTADIPALKENTSLAVYQGESNYIEYLAFNVTVAPFDNLKVRQAVAKCFDKRDVVTIAVDDLGGVLSASYTNATLFGANTDIPLIEKDIEGAKQLLAEAGYPDGFTCSITAIDGARKKSAQVIQSGLKEIGIDAQIDIMESGAFYDAAGKGNVEMCLGGMTTLAADADPLLFCCFSSQNIGTYNLSQYSNAEIDNLITESRANSDTESRRQQLKNIQTIVSDDLPSVPLYLRSVLIVANANLKGVEVEPNNILDVAKLSW